jgi:hypothetical protein
MLASERFWKWVWLAAVAQNTVAGIGLFFLGDWLYAREGLAPPVPAVNSYRWYLLILVFGYLYYRVYRDLYHNRNLVIAGILGKLASATPDLYYLTLSDGVPAVFWIATATDYAFVVLFVLFLRFVTSEKRRRAAHERELSTRSAVAG